MSESNQPRHLALVIHSLDGGGAEHVATEMANQWSAMGYEVTLITLDSAERDRFPLSAQVSRVALDVMGPSANVLKAVFANRTRVRRLRAALRETAPQVIVSLTDKTNILTLLAARRLKIGVVACEWTDPRCHRIGRLWETLRRWTYPMCRALVVQTGNVHDVCRAFASTRPIHVVPNFVREPGVRRGNRDTQTRRVVALGRLAPEKGFDLLIAAFARLADRHPDWNLLILGEGPHRDVLEREIHRHALEDRVQLPGWEKSPAQPLIDSDLFVLSSQYEGFPNALLEAMACKVACISFDCPSGPGEIIRDGVDGLLVPPQDVAALTAAMDELMSDENRRHEIARRATEVLERFSVQAHFERWDAILREAHSAVNPAADEEPSRTAARPKPDGQ